MDAPDSISMFASEIILGTNRIAKPIPIDRREWGI